MANPCQNIISGLIVIANIILWYYCSVFQCSLSESNILSGPTSATCDSIQNIISVESLCTDTEMVCDFELNVDILGALNGTVSALCPINTKSIVYGGYLAGATTLVLILLQLFLFSSQKGQNLPLCLLRLGNAVITGVIAILAYRNIATSKCQFNDYAGDSINDFQFTGNQYYPLVSAGLLGIVSLFCFVGSYLALCGAKRVENEPNSTKISMVKGTNVY